MNEYKEIVDTWLVDRGIVFQQKRIGLVTQFGYPKEAFMVSFYRNNDAKSRILITEFYGNEEPSAYDVLSYLTKDEIGDIWDFFRDYGYEPTKENFSLYDAVKVESKKVTSFFTQSELEDLKEITI